MASGKFAFLHPAQCDRLAQLLRQLIARKGVGLAVVWGSVEVAEGTTGGADVGVVDIAIDDVGHHALGMQCLPTKVRSLAQIEQGCFRVQAHSFFDGHPLARSRVC